MSRAMAISGLVLCAALAWLGSPCAGGAEQPLVGPVLLLPGTKEPLRLRLDVGIDGQPPTAAWEAFLERLFDFFDRDGDGSLSRDEVRRMMPLPLPGGKELTIDFAKLDADGDGKASRTELKAYCRRNGFGPVVVVVEPPSADDLRLADLFLRRLDADGQLTRAKLQRAPELLRKFDLNEDEYLDAAELLASAPPASGAGAAQVRLDEKRDGHNAILRLDLGEKARTPTLDGQPVKIVPGGLHRLYGAEGRWTVAVRTTRTVPDVAAAGEFLVAQFEAALGDRPALSKADLEQDAGLSGLRELFRYADRNGDDRLSSKELKEYLRLVDLGMRAQVWIRVTDHARNPFHFLDTDGDGRLSYRELTQAADLLPPDAAQITGLPLQFHLSFGGPAVKSWGGVPVPAMAKRPRPQGTALSQAPRWFQAMDRNGDGVISPGEFPGPPELFRKLDLNGDGVISPEEAARAGSR